MCSHIEQTCYKACNTLYKPLLVPHRNLHLNLFLIHSTFFQTMRWSRDYSKGCWLALVGKLCPCASTSRCHFLLNAKWPTQHSVECVHWSLFLSAKGHQQEFRVTFYWTKWDISSRTTAVVLNVLMSLFWNCGADSIWRCNTLAICCKGRVTEENRLEDLWVSACDLMWELHCQSLPLWCSAERLMWAVISMWSNIGISYPIITPGVFLGEMQVWNVLGTL